MRRALGRGLSQLVAEQFDSSPTEIDIADIVPNPRQPRTQFDETALAELADSIRQFGVIQPLLVKPIGEDRYELIAGERRLRASKLAGLSRVPVVVRSAGDQSSLEIALIENIQREDINAIECARAYQRLVVEFSLTQEQVAEKVGKSRAAVANHLRLLRLPKKISEAVEQGTISEGHGRALLGLDSEAKMLAVFELILAKGLTVRDVEQIAKQTPKDKTPEKRTDKPLDPNLAEIQNALTMHFGSPVKIAKGTVGGRLVIDYYSDDDLTRILDVLGLGD